MGIGKKERGCKAFCKRGENKKKTKRKQKSDFSFFLAARIETLFFSTSTPLNSAFGGLYPVTNQLASTLSAMTN